MIGTNNKPEKGPNLTNYRTLANNAERTKIEFMYKTDFVSALPWGIVKPYIYSTSNTIETFRLKKEAVKEQTSDLREPAYAINKVRT